MLLDNKADINYRATGLYNTALDCACRSGKIELIQVILDQLQYSDELLLRCIQDYLGTANTCEKVIMHLIGLIRDINFRLTSSHSQDSILDIAIKRKAPWLVRVLQDLGAKISSEAFELACYLGNTDIVSELLLWKSDAIDSNRGNISVEAAFYYACLFTNLSLAQHLLEAKSVEVNSTVLNRTLTRVSPKIYEMGGRGSESVKYLMKRGAVFIDDENDALVISAFLEACRGHDLEVIDMLIRRGANVNKLAYKYRTAERGERVAWFELSCDTVTE